MEKITDKYLAGVITDEYGVKYSPDGTRLLKAPQDLTGSYTIKPGTKDIRCCAFSGCESLTSIGIPDSVTSIGDGAFDRCSSLSNIAIPESVRSIGKNAFCGCSSLTSIAIPNSVKSIGMCAFAECKSLTCIEIPSSVTNIGYSAFLGCESLSQDIEKEIRERFGIGINGNVRKGIADMESTHYMHIDKLPNS